MNRTEIAGHGLQTAKVASAVVILGVGFALLSPGLNPKALWLNDCWQATLSQQDVFTQFRLRSSASIGFTWFLGVVAKISEDPELGPQLLPFFSGVAMIAVAFWAYPRTKEHAMGRTILAAALAVCPPVLTYSSRVKQFTFDALLVTVLLALALHVSRAGRHLEWFAVAALFALPFSFCSNIFATIFLNVACCFAFWRATKQSNFDVVRIVVTWFGYHALLGMYCFVVLIPQKNASLSGFWTGYYIDSFRDVVQNLAMLFFRSLPWYGSFSCKAMEIALASVAFLFFVAGIVRLVRHRRFMAIGISAVLYYLALVVLSALHLYPLGSLRADIHAHPITLFLFVFGVGALLRKMPKNERIKLAVHCFAILVVGTWGIFQLFTFDNYYYPGGNTPNMAKVLRSNYKEGDSVIVYPHGSLALAYYGGFEYELKAVDYYGWGFEPVFRAMNLHVLPGLDRHRKQPWVLNSSIDQITEQNPETIFFWASHAQNRPARYIHLRIQKAGFRGRGLFRHSGSLLIQYERWLQQPVPKQQNEPLSQ